MEPERVDRERFAAEEKRRVGVAEAAAADE